MAVSLREKIKRFPDLPGVYIMKSAKGQILYVGKASSLRKRVSSYFSPSPKQEKVSVLMSKVADVEFIVCDTEAQAFLLEAALIKEHRPRYNVSLRDDKSYPYIEITADEFPRIFVSRPHGGTDSVLIGPYPNVKLLKQALEIIRKIFPFRSCRRMPKVPCLFYHLRLCPAPCAGYISSDEYARIVESIKRILRGEKKVLIKELEKSMFRYAEKGEFEKAAGVRDRLFSILSLYAGRPQMHEIVALKEVLGLAIPPLVIEAIDISNLSGKEATGSVVVFRDGAPDKSAYRRFRIKTVSSPDDYQMMAEVVRRRYGRLKEEGRDFPDLVVVDGGRQHLSRVSREFKKMGMDVPVVAIAKKNEELWVKGRARPLILPRDNPALQLIQRVRDEAHRFARKYHHLLRKKGVLG